MINTSSTDLWLLLSTRALRLFAYGFLSVVLVLYLSQIGLSAYQIGLLLTLTLIGDTCISLWLTTHADRWGRRRLLVIGAGLIVFAGVLFILTTQFMVLLFAATLGVISPSGNEVGPFLSIEQAALSQLLPDKQRTQVFAWYNLIGAVALALGALCSGALVQLLEEVGFSSVSSYKVVLFFYALGGVLIGVLFLKLSPAVEVHSPTTSVTRQFLTGLHRSRTIIWKLSSLFALDAFAGGFVMQSVMAYWFYLRFDIEPVVLGSIFFGANLLAAVSSLLAGWLAQRIGLINTMVFTHVPSNLLLILVPFMPTLQWAIFVLLLRFSISQMDVPTRQSYTMAIVAEDERSAAAGVTNTARTIGSALAPILTVPLLANPALAALPFVIAGGLKIVYDLLLYLAFVKLKPREEINDK